MPLAVDMLIFLLMLCVVLLEHVYSQMFDLMSPYL